MRLLLPIALLACNGGKDDDQPEPSPEVTTTAVETTSYEWGDPEPPYPIPAEEQRELGDPEEGYRLLVNEGYVGCGIPWTAYEQLFFAAPESERLEGREGKNEQLPYQMNVFTTPTGVEVVAATCLQCHAAKINGELHVGLGDSSTDYTQPLIPGADFLSGFMDDPDELAEYDKWWERTSTVAPFLTTKTVGVNPADNLAAVLFAHRDSADLSWSNTPLAELPLVDPLPVDVPPWWRMQKKNALYYSAAGRGDHGRLMMTASTLCVDDPEHAASIDEYFHHIRAYILSIEPLPYTESIDAGQAAEGEQIFEATCSECHGTYGPDGEYPNLLVPLNNVRTDRHLAGGAQYTEHLVDWFNDSFYGETARMQPEPGYYAPPLDGIWSTAPFLHNGSVPTLYTLLNSSERPTYWQRTFDSYDYDYDEVGWGYKVKNKGHKPNGDYSTQKLIYDTTQFGYGNGGHTYGDGLTEEERWAVIEYLKTI